MIDKDFERRWASIRVPKIVSANGEPYPASDERTALLRAFREYKHHPHPERALDPAEPIIDELYELQLKLMQEHGLEQEDDKQAYELLVASPKGRQLIARLDAAQGRAPIDLAGEEYLGSTKLSKATKRLYRGAYKHAASKLRSPAFVTKDDARQYLQAVAKENTLRTAGNYRAALRGLWGHLGLDVAIWSMFKISSPNEAIDVRPFTDEELKKLLAGASAKLRQAILIAAYTGARASGVASLEYDAEHDWLVINETKTKASKRTIPCPNAIRKTVKEWLQDPWKTTTISNRFSELKARLGFNDRAECFHSLRHTFTTRMRELGVQEADVAAITGHKHQSITFGRYGDKVGVETLRATINKLRYKT